MPDIPQPIIPETQLFADAFNASPIGIVVEDMEGQPLFVNPAFCNFLGFTEEELRHKHCVDFSPPEDAQKDWECFQQLRAGTIDHYQLEKRYFRRDGSIIWGRLSISLLNHRPAPLVVAMVEDITSKKRAEDALRMSEERFRLAQQAARIGTFERNLRTDFVTWTPELESIYGLRAGQFTGTRMAFAKLVHPDDRDRVAKLTEEAIETGRPTSGEWRAIWPDRSIHWIAGWWQVFKDQAGQPARMLGINMDITDRKLGETRLHEYERAVEGSQEMIAVVDRDYRFLIANRQFVTTRGAESEQVIGKFVSEVVEKKTFEEIVQPKLEEAFHGKVVRFEMKYTYPQLGERELSVSYHPIEGPRGVDRVACILHDITELKRAEEALAGMSRKLIEAQEQERRSIARELHDDINQRLALVAVELQRLQDDPSELKTRLQALRQSTVEITDDIQALSHELHSSKLEYLGVVPGIRGWCGEFGDRHRMEVHFKSEAARAIPVEIGLCLFRILQEALHNAARHSGAKRIDVQLTESPAEVHLLVSDAGTGFNIEEARQGRGLGLLSMQERVRLVSGSITIDSTLNTGTTIHVRVPLPPDSGAQLAAG